jgi:hypothetical protein
MNMGLFGLSSSHEQSSPYFLKCCEIVSILMELLIDRMENTQALNQNVHSAILPSFAVSSKSPKRRRNYYSSISCDTRIV